MIVRSGCRFENWKRLASSPCVMGNMKCKASGMLVWCFVDDDMSLTSSPSLTLLSTISHSSEAVEVVSSLPITMYLLYSTSTCRGGAYEVEIGAFLQTPQPCFHRDLHAFWIATLSANFNCNQQMNQWSQDFVLRFCGKKNSKKKFNA